MVVVRVVNIFRVWRCYYNYLLKMFYVVYRISSKYCIWYILQSDMRPDGLVV